MPEAVALLSGQKAFELDCFPFSLEGNQIRVAFTDPLDALAIEEVEDETGCYVEAFKSLSREISWALATHYPELGLKPPRDVSCVAGARIGSLAVERGLATLKKVEEATAEQQRTNGLLDRTLVDQETLTKMQLTELLASQAGLDV